MANICNTEVRVFGDKAHLLYEKLKPFFDDNKCIYHIAKDFGLDPDAISYGRGEIIDLEESSGDVMIVFESAWVPPTLLLKKINEYFNDELYIAWYAEEPGFYVYEMHDPDHLAFPNWKYVYDSCDFNGIDPGTDVTEDAEEIIKMWCDAMNITLNGTTEEKIEFINNYKYDDDSYFSINKIEQV